MSLREWLVLIGIIVIAVVLIDGYRRMRLAKKRASELSFGLEEVKGDAEEFGSELPNGGARRPYRSGHHEVKDKSSQDRHQTRRVEPGLSGMELGDFGDNTDALNTSNASGENSDAGSGVFQGIHNASLKNNEGSGDGETSTLPVLTDLDKPAELSKKRKIKAERDFMPHDLGEEPGETSAEGSSKFEDRLSKYKSKKMARQEAKGEATEKLSDRPPAKEVIVINVIAKGEQAFDGAGLLQSLLSSGMRFGDMSIFHRYANDNGTGKILFSMANGVEPGIFSVDDIDGTSTPAVSFFMGLPGPGEPLKAFTKMVETARQLALDLGGELKDEQFSVMTQQTIEHCRQRIIDYERKQLAHRMPG